MFKSALYALGTAVVAVSAINPAQAANPNGRVTTTADVRSMISDDLGLKYTIDDEGDIKISYADAPTIWVLMMDADFKPLKANSKGNVAVVKFISFPDSKMDTSDDTYYTMVIKAEELNSQYRFKFYANRTKESTAIVMERYEFVTPETRRGHISKAYTMFARTLKAVTD